MEEIKINNFHELHEAIQAHRNWKTIFRGHGDSNWDLLPSAGRLKGFGDNDAFEYWIGKSAKHFKNIHYSCRLELLAIAQHHGLPTRLLDWTINPLSAAFFAVAESNGKSDAAVYILEMNRHLDNKYFDDPFNDDLFSIYQYTPPNIEDRIIAQQGVFTYHSSPEINLKDDIPENCRLIKLLIKREYTIQLANELDAYGVNYMTMYPDMDGTSKYVMWHMKRPIPIPT